MTRRASTFAAALAVVLSTRALQAAEPGRYVEVTLLVNGASARVYKHTVRRGVLAEPSRLALPAGHWIVRAQDGAGRDVHIASMPDPRLRFAGWDGKNFVPPGILTGEPIAAEHASAIVWLPDDARIRTIRLARLKRSLSPAERAADGGWVQRVAAGGTEPLALADDDLDPAGAAVIEMR